MSMMSNMTSANGLDGGVTLKRAIRSVGNNKDPKKEKMEKIYNSFTAKQKEAFDLAMKGENLFITGGAGVGKSHTIHGIVYSARNLHAKNVMIVAPTGIAAINAGDGVTIHRQFGFPVSPCLTNDLKRPLARANKALKYCDLLIIDEISMVRIDIFDSIVASINKANQARELMGLKNIQLIVCGDFYQIQPIITDSDREILEKYYNSKRHSVTGKLGSGYAFNSVNWIKMNFQNIILTETMRQKNMEMVYHLNKIREGEHGYTNYFNHASNMDKIEFATTLRPYNADVRRENLENLAKIDGKEYIFTAELSGQATEEDCKGIYELHLKVGAKVMFLANDNPGRPNDLIRDRPEAFQDKVMFVNGTMGVLRKITVSDNGLDDYLTVETCNGDIINLRKGTTEVSIYEEKDGKLVKKKIGSYRQYNLTAAFAISTHKSQGCSLDAVNIDPKSFTHGQLYVALSRCRSMEGTHLEDFIREDALIMDPDVKHFYASITEVNDKEIDKTGDKNVSA